MEVNTQQNKIHTNLLSKQNYKKCKYNSTTLPFLTKNAFHWRWSNRIGVCGKYHEEFDKQGYVNGKCLEKIVVCTQQYNKLPF
jgi:hypothetical protein